MSIDEKAGSRTRAAPRCYSIVVNKTGWRGPVSKKCVMWRMEVLQKI
jgi:hypothetical protein